MVWGSRKDRVGDLRSLWPLLLFWGLDASP
jgi:hypothetical protein